jgi:uncharacterized protein
MARRGGGGHAPLSARYFCSHHRAWHPFACRAIQRYHPAETSDSTSMMQFFILLGTALVAALLSSMSGAGAGIIIAPVLLSLGIPFPAIVAANSASGLFWVVPASRNYLRGRKVDWQFLLLFGLLGLTGIYFGFRAATKISVEHVKPVIGTVILLLVIYSCLNSKLGAAAHEVTSKARRASGYIFAPVLGFYEGFFGSGNGIAFTLVTTQTRGFDFIDALGGYYAISFIWLAATVALYVWQGFLDVGIFVPLLVGSLIGGYVGSRYAKYKGNRYIRVIFVSLGGLLGLKLVLGL